jgi:carotenoid cleavage dioxygenase
MDLPIVFDFERAMSGSGFPYRWSDDYGARVGIMPRGGTSAGGTSAGGTSAEVRWFEVEPCYVFHPLNAFAEGDRVIVDVARYPHLWRGGADSFTAAFLHRWTLDLTNGAATEESLDDRAIEFPRVDDRRNGRAHRYGYAVHSGSGVGTQAAALVKYDLRTGNSEVRDFGPGCAPGEGVFVPAADDAGEDEGFVLTLVYDGNRNASDFVILDASNFQAAPVATVALPRRVPFGFHGNWVADQG